MRSPHLALLLLLCACGFSVEGAREDLTQRGCAYFSRCGQLVPGNLYASQAECVTQLRAFWLKQLPTADCTKGIVGSAYDVCTAAISVDRCAYFPVAAFSTCSKQHLCAP